MIGTLRSCLAASTLLAALFVLGVLPLGAPALAQKQDGILEIAQYDSPASMSIHEKSSNTVEGLMMGVFNNLVRYDQHEPQNSLQSIWPDLATDWSWDKDRSRLTFRLGQAVQWHDGKPFAARDVKCTWDLLAGKGGREGASQPPRGVVTQPAGSHHQRRLGGHIQSAATAAGIPCVVGVGLGAGLSLSNLAA